MTDPLVNSSSALQFRRSATRRLATAGLVALMTGFALPPCAAAEFSRWYRIELDGQAAGRLHEWSEDTASGLRWHAQLQIVLDRAGHRVEFNQHTETLENADGLVEKIVDGDVAGERVHLEAHVIDHHVRVQVATAGGHSEHDYPTPRLMGPEAVRRQTLEKMRVARDTIAYHDVSEATGEPTTVVRELTTSLTPDSPIHIIERTEQDSTATELTLDADGYVIESLEESPLGHLTIRVASAAIAEETWRGAPIPLAGELPSAVMLPDPRRIESLELLITPHHATLRSSDFEGPGQHVQPGAGATFRLRTDRPGTDPLSHQRPVIDEQQANALFTSESAEVRELAQRLTVGHTTDSARIEALVSWVHQTLQFDPGFAIADALDVLHRRRGTCVAYATLTATLLRAAGFPSRMVYGYAYADGNFIGHAWTEVWTNQRWRAVDAALHQESLADAARIALARSDGASGPASGLDRLLRTFGAFDVAVNAYVLDGQRTELNRQPR